MSWEAWPLLSTTSCLHTCTSKIPQGVQTLHGVMAEAMHIVCSVDMALALVQAFQEEARVLVHVFHRLERVLAEPLTHPRNDGLVQEEVRQVCRLLCAVGTGKGTKAVADEGCVVSTINAWRLSRASHGPVTVESPRNACQARPTAQLVHHVEPYRRILEPLHTLNAWRFSRASTGPVTVESPRNACQARPAAQLVHLWNLTAGTLSRSIRSTHGVLVEHQWVLDTAESPRGAY